MAISTVKKNFGWNFLLMVSGYLFPLLTFPYITRVMGPESLGLGNFVLSIIDYAILFSSFGISTIGARYIPQCNDDKESRNRVFNSLVSLHFIMSFIVLVVYFLAVFIIPELHEHKFLYGVGAIKILMNVFLVEWLFQGMQDFRYITIRTIIIRLVYVLGVFLLIHSPMDYDWYVYITIGQVVINAIVNWKYAKRFIVFRFNLNNINEFIFPVLSMGINRILLSFYTTFIVLYLGFVCSNLAVGYFTTATKLYSIFIGLISAFNGVLVPHLNSLIGQGNYTEFKNKVCLSFSLISIFSIPFTIIAIFLAPEIINFIAGEGYKQAVLPFQIISIQIILVSLAQITENQILLSLKKFKEVLYCTLASTLLSVCIMVAFAQQYAEVAGALAVAIPHFVECFLLFYYAKKTLDFSFPFKEMCMTLFISVPIAIYCIFLKSFISNYMLVLIFGFLISIVYYFIMQYFIVRNTFFVTQINNILNINREL